MKIWKFSGLLAFPLAFCANVPEPQADLPFQLDASLVEYVKSNAVEFTEQASAYFEYAQKLADSALSTYNGKDKKDNWPKNIDELIKLIDTKLAINSADVSSPMNDFFNMAKAEIHGNHKEKSKKKSDKNPIDELFGPGTAENLIKDASTMNVDKTVDDLIKSFGGASDKALDFIKSGSLNPKTFNEFLEFVGKTIIGVYEKKIDVSAAVKHVANFLKNMNGSKDPVVKFLQNLSEYLKKNPNVGKDLADASFSKFAEELAKKVMESISKYITAAIKHRIMEFFNEIFSKLLLGKNMLLQRLQDVTEEDVIAVQSELIRVIKAEGSADAASYTDHLFKTINAITKNIYTLEPNLVDIVSNPTEENIRKLVVTLARVLSIDK